MPACACRCLTDTLVHVPSDPDPDGENVRDQVFGAIVHYISQRAAFPPCQQGMAVILLVALLIKR